MKLHELSPEHQRVLLKDIRAQYDGASDGEIILTLWLRIGELADSESRLRSPDTMGVVG